MIERGRRSRLHLRTYGYIAVGVILVVSHGVVMGKVLDAVKWHLFREVRTIKANGNVKTETHIYKDNL